jgi:hypothetical protein
MQREWGIAGEVSCWLGRMMEVRKLVASGRRATSEKREGSSEGKKGEVRGDSIHRLTLYQCLRREELDGRDTSSYRGIQQIMYVPLGRWGYAAARFFSADIGHIGMRVGNGEQ